MRVHLMILIRRGIKHQPSNSCRRFLISTLKSAVLRLLPVYEHVTVVPLHYMLAGYS